MSNESQNTNMAIWDQVKETDASAIKQGDFQGRQLTSINGIYVIKKATEIWGPIGKGWGYEISEERFDNAKPVYLNGEIQGHEIVHTIKLKLWYMDGGEKYHLENYGHTPFVYWSFTYKSFNTDFDFAKKSLTDAVKKCLSFLGFSADVYGGQFDDEQYFEEVKQKSNVRKENERDEEIAKRRKDFKEWFEDQIKSFDDVNKAGALQLKKEEIEKRAQRDANLAQLDYAPWARALNKAYQERLNVINPDVALVCKECGVENKGKKGSACKECGGETAPIK